MGGTGSFEGIEGTVDVVTITGSTGPIPLVESPSYDSTGLIPQFEFPNYDSTGLPIFESPSYDSYMYRTWYVANWICTIVRRNTSVLLTKGYNIIDLPVMRELGHLQYLHGAQINNEPVQLGFVSFGKTVLKIVVKSNIPLPVAP